MEIDKRKHQIIAGVSPLPKGYRAVPTEKQYRDVPFDRGLHYYYGGETNCWFNKGDKYFCKDTNKNSVVFIDKNKDTNPLDLESAIKYFSWDKSKYTTEKPKEDRVNHPSHYTWLKDLCNIEVIDITRHLNFNVGNAIKYLLRKDKEDIISLRDKRIEDLKKAVWYINDEIKRLESCTK